MGAQGLTERERAVLARLDSDALVRDVETMVGFAPVGGSTGEVAVQRWAASRLRDLGCRVDEWEVDLATETRAEGFPGMEVDRDSLVGVVARWDGPGNRRRPDEPPGLVLCGHTDVVPPGDTERWTHDPFGLEVRDGRLWGRGACDMLAGVAAVIAAVEAVVRAGLPLSRPLGVHLVSGEEDGGVGAFATLRAGHGGAACVIAEPTGGAVIPANAGSLTFRLEVPGRAAHGSTRTLGENPLDHLGPLLTALRELEAWRNTGAGGLFGHLDLAAPLSVGVVRAGDWASTVPDVLVAEGRYGVLPGEKLEEARQAFEEAVLQAGQADPWLRDHPVRVTWTGGIFAPGQLPDDHPLLAEVLEAAADGVGAPPAVAGAPYGSDLRHYVAHGIPTVQFGPGELRDAHAVDESVLLHEVIACARTYALLAVRRCGDERKGGSSD